jgi:uncharacterized protein (TIGR02118 family)
MVKYVSLLRRAEHLSREQFHRWWIDEHTLIAKRIPGLRRYVVSLAVGGLDGEAEWDGMAELWFDDEAALRAGMLESPEGQAALADSAAHISRSCRFITREHPVIGGAT